MSAHYDVSEIIIPIPLTPDSVIPPWSSPATRTEQQSDTESNNSIETKCFKHIEVVLRNLKAFLTASAPESLKTITLVVPPFETAANLLKKIKTWL